MKRTSLGTRLGLVVLAALLALPLAQTAPPLAAKQRTRTLEIEYHNDATIEIPIGAVSPVSASLYPSRIVVDAPKRARILDVEVELSGFKHTNPDDVEVLLVGPRGQTAVIMANVGGTTDVEDERYFLFDGAVGFPLPDSTTLEGGGFLPTNATGMAIAFNDPAPNAGANSALSVFDGTNPHGTWRLFVQDEFATSDAGAFVEGWELQIEMKVKPKKKRR
jgi:subtilisin-like proprotein convertase family protein